MTTESLTGGHFGVFNSGNSRIDNFFKSTVIGETVACKVYLAVDKVTGEKKAVKVTDISKLKPRTLLKLQAELNIHRTLINENIVRAYGGCKNNNEVFMLMNYCDNFSLKDLLSKSEKISDVDANGYLSQIVNGLMYLKSELIIHRDIKLGNIFLHGNTIKIGDFGLCAKLANADEKRKTICGTPNYISPEVLFSGSYSFETDVWSTGICFYAMLYGVCPFSDKDVKTTYIRIKTGTITFVNDENISDESKELINRMIQTNIKERIKIEEMII